MMQEWAFENQAIYGDGPYPTEKGKKEVMKNFNLCNLKRVKENNVGVKGLCI